MATLDAWIARVRSLPELGKRAAPDVADMLERELRGTIAAGQSPDGAPLELTQEGEVPLTGAGKALGVAAIGGTVYVRLKGVEAAHHLGRVRGGKARQLIPVNALPPAMAEATARILSKHFTDTMTGKEAGVL